MSGSFTSTYYKLLEPLNDRLVKYGSTLNSSFPLIDFISLTSCTDMLLDENSPVHWPACARLHSDYTINWTPGSRSQFRRDRWKRYV